MAVIFAPIALQSAHAVKAAHHSILLATTADLCSWPWPDNLVKPANPVYYEIQAVSFLITERYN